MTGDDVRPHAPGECAKPVGREGSETWRESSRIADKIVEPIQGRTECKEIRDNIAAALAAAEKRAKYFEEAGIEAQREKAAAEKALIEYHDLCAKKENERYSLQQKLDAALRERNEAIRFLTNLAVMPSHWDDFEKEITEFLDRVNHDTSPSF